MTRDLYPRWWRCAEAFALLLALVLLLVPQHGHASLLFTALAPVLWLFSVVVTQPQSASVAEPIFALDLLLRLPSLSHLPPPGTLA
ncbi:MAG: hypothetical protein WCB58_04855 [Acidobacteriaceae bacterium]